METEALKKRIAENLADHYFQDSNGLFYNEIYKDYRDELSEGTVKEIINAEDPESRLYELLDESYREEIWRLEDEAIDQLRQDPELEEAWKEDEDLFRDLVFDQFYVKVPFDDFLKEEQEINIVLDTGDCNYDFVLNSFAHGYYGDREEGVDEHSSLLWLCRQQGVSKEELETALKTGSCYPENIEAVMERHAEVHKALKALGYVPDKPMDPYNQKGEFKTLLRAELAVRNLEQKVRKCESNLASCDLSYEAFCEKWNSMHSFKEALHTPPSEVAWERKKQYVREQNTELLNSLRPQLEQARTDLKTCLQDPSVAMTADLRERLREINEEYIPMRQTADFAKGRFLESVITESANTTSHMNALTALVKMPLRDAIQLAKAIKVEAPLNDSYVPEERKGEGSILLDKDTVLGLYDSWNGAGGLFEIKLMAPLELPIRLIHDANVDGNLGYGIYQIYGGMEYGESLQEIRSMPEPPIKQPLAQTVQAAQNTAHIPQNMDLRSFHSER